MLLRLGLWSYGIYLANEPIQKALGVGLAWLAGGDARLFTMLWVPAALVLPVLAAAWLHRLVEAPALRAGRALAAYPRIRIGEIPRETPVSGVHSQG